MDLLARALQAQSLASLANRLGIPANNLRTAKNRGRLTPAVAGSLAEEMDEDPSVWIIAAALEVERDSACKTRMIRRFFGM